MVEASHSAGEETRHGGGVLRWVWIAGLALVLYALSIGPAYKFATGLISSGVIVTVYSPILWTAGRVPWVNDLLEWYVYSVWRTPVQM